MADKNERREANTAGSWYVDENCIGCGVCAEEAPEIFEMDDDNLAFVKKQPADDAESEASTSAMESCPVEAIGNDG
jgi:ferredoxin